MNGKKLKTKEILRKKLNLIVSNSKLNKYIWVDDMKKFIILFSAMILIFNNVDTLFAQSKSIYKYKVIIDLGSDNTDPLFTEFSLKNLIKERIAERFPEFIFSEREDASIIFYFTLLTQTGEKVCNNYISSLNCLVTSFFNNPWNRTVLLVESNQEVMKQRIYDYIDKWILEYALLFYKSK